MIFGICFFFPRSFYEGKIPPFRVSKRERPMMFHFGVISIRPVEATEMVLKVGSFPKMPASGLVFATNLGR